DLKGDLETLLASFELPDLHLDTQAVGNYHPGRSARVTVEGKAIAEFGQVHPDLAGARKLKQELYVAEIYLDRLFALPLRTIRYEALSKYPAVGRDFSFLFADTVTFAQIQTTVDALTITELRSFISAEIFRGGSVPQGKYSVLLRAEFQSAERTLRDDEVAHWSAQIIKALESAGGSIRS
ncbi:MAG: phenylalanine--tRNA ligase subunit beta, partial [Candidatus Angelobacter sp.]